MRRPLLPVILLLLLLLPVDGRAESGFARWKESFAARLAQQGYRAETIALFRANAVYLEKPLRAQARQPEKTITFAAYRRYLLTPQRIDGGRQALREQGPLLTAAAAEYGIEREILAALWGVESNYGKGMGGNPLIASLATLAYGGKRRDFFEGELLALLRLAEERGLPAGQMAGSWAGAMGHYQFIPSTARRFCVDGDGDGRVDLCGSYPDALASAGNYLKALGWRPGDGRIIEVDQARGAKLLRRTKGKPAAHPPAYWRQAGLLPAGSAPDHGALKLVCADDGRGGCFLAGAGFDRLKQWNRSTYFALTILLLADQLTRAEGIAAPN